MGCQAGTHSRQVQFLLCARLYITHTHARTTIMAQSVTRSHSLYPITQAQQHRNGHEWTPQFTLCPHDAPYLSIHYLFLFLRVCKGSSRYSRLLLHNMIHRLYNPVSCESCTQFDLLLHHNTLTTYVQLVSFQYKGIRLYTSMDTMTSPRAWGETRS